MNCPQNKGGAPQLPTQFRWYALTPVWPDIFFGRMYLVLLRDSGLSSITVPLAVLYLLIVLLSPHCPLTHLSADRPEMILQARCYAK
jgi:hypothetical protein